MKLIDIYNEYKSNYKEYVIFIKSGIFYEVFNSDVSIMYSLFNYKIKYLGNTYKVGFPVNNLGNILANLKKNKINYIVLDKNSDSNYFISDKYKNNDNCYSNYKIDFNRINYLYNRINNINNKLIDKVFDNNIEDMLFKIEEIV